MGQNGEKGQRVNRGLLIGITAFLLVCGAAGAYATFTSNAQTAEVHGHAGTLSSTVTGTGVWIQYGTPALASYNYASCVQAPYGPAPTTDVVVNATNLAPGDSCTANFTLTDTGSLPGILSDTMGLSSYGICSTPSQINCYEITDSLAGVTNATIGPGGTYSWSITIELAPGSTAQGIAASYLANVHESAGT